MKQRLLRLAALLLVLLLGLTACSVGQLVDVLDEAAGQLEYEDLPLYEQPEKTEELPAEEETQPAVQEQPAEVEEPAEIEEPVEIEEPAEVEEPVETEEPAEAEEPAEVEEPAEAEEPAETEQPAEENSDETDDVEVVYGEEYDTPETVAAYLHQYRELPPNFITKYDAQDKGWDSSKGNLWKVAPGCSIGGDTFGNREGILPKGKYHECDVNYEGGYRGSERIVWSSDGAIYYTNDHYESFTQLYEGWAS